MTNVTNNGLQIPLLANCYEAGLGDLSQVAWGYSPMTTLGVSGGILTAPRCRLISHPLSPSARPHRTAGNSVAPCQKRACRQVGNLSVATSGGMPYSCATNLVLAPASGYPLSPVIFFMFMGMMKGRCGIGVYLSLINMTAPRDPVKRESNGEHDTTPED